MLFKYENLKFTIDKLFSLVLIIITFPLILLLIIFIKLEDPKGSAIFKQKRIGYLNQQFEIYKLRSMKIDMYDAERKLTDNERMLKIGKIIRSLSLDELPQLFNVSKGDMSFIGPRPLSIKYLDYYTEEEKIRHNVKPGITGLAQINGRNNISWEEKFNYDIQYVNQQSLTLDLKILFFTIIKVIKKSDVTVRGQGTEVDFHEYRKSNSEK